MTWRRFADEMPPEREGQKIVAWTVDDEAVALFFEDDFWRESDGDAIDPTSPYWTHWQLVEPPAEEA